MSETQSSGGGSGLGCLGFVVAFGLSWTTHHSLGWAFVHMLCSWFYVIYWIVTQL